MGGGIAGWLTPGWMQYDSSLAPHISAPGYIKTKLAEGEDPKPEPQNPKTPSLSYYVRISI